MPAVMQRQQILVVGSRKMITSTHEKDCISASGFEVATNNTCGRILPEEMDAMVRWSSLIGIIQGYVSVAKSVARRSG